MHIKPEKFRSVVVIESVRRKVESELRKAIVEGKFPPGTHLSDRKLQETFEVSRTVIREAIRQVEAEGLIETIPHRGSFVKKLTIKEAEHVYAIRGVLEGLAAKEFVQNADEKEIEKLESIVNKIRRHLNRRKLLEVVELKHQFYDVLLNGCQNPYINTILAPLLNINRQLRATSLSDHARLPHTVSELEDLVKAIKARDSEAAWRASLKHVENAQLVAIKLLTMRDNNEIATRAVKLNSKSA